MSRTLNRDYALEVARGNISGVSSVNKYGRSKNVDSGVTTDVWDGANATDDQAIWLAPLAARLHDVVSTSTDDDGDPVGTGAQTVRIYGLTAWNTAEVTEDITMNGTTDVVTINLYTMINRVEVIAYGSAGPNVGVISVTSRQYNTLTAQINAGEGRTQMAIYGVPSTQSMYVNNFAFSILKANLGTTEVHADLDFVVNIDPENEPTVFITRDTFGIGTRSNSPADIVYRPPLRIDGPCIVKIQAIASANNTDIHGSWDAFLVDN